MRYVSFEDDRNLQADNELLQQRPADSPITSSFRGISIKSGRDCIGSGTFCCNCVFYGRDVRADRATQIAVNTADQFGPWLRFKEAPTSAIESDEIRAGVTDSLCRFEVRCDVNVTVRIVRFNDSYNREIGHRPKGSYALGAFSPEATCSTTDDGGRHSGERVDMIERIVLSSLAGDYEPVL